MRRTVRYLETEIKRFKKHIGEAIKPTASFAEGLRTGLTAFPVFERLAGLPGPCS